MTSFTSSLSPFAAFIRRIHSHTIFNTVAVADPVVAEPDTNTIESDDELAAKVEFNHKLPVDPACDNDSAPSDPRDTPAIALRGVKKTYSGGTLALHDVNLTVESGDIYGIIGLSGAGKSTLVRILNGLESYDEGSVQVLGQEVGDLKGRELRTLRRDVAMIFQQFNLMPSRTAADNIELALDGSNLSREERTARVRELLDLVELSDKADSYPSELSGGQKQRVAIARALANRPRILLSDEATSALDPTTTRSILALLKSLRDKLGLTIIVITHQMSVIKEIATNVAVIDQGTIVEQGRVFDIFANPQAPLTRSFVATTSNLGKVQELIDADSPLVAIKPGQVLLSLRYVAADVSEALVSHVSKNFNVDVNIIFGDVDVIDGAPLGGIIVIIDGEKKNIDAAIHYLVSRNINVEVIKK